jgi:hypothetical protein
MRLDVGFIQREGFECGRPGLRCSIFGRDEPVILVDVVERERAVGLRVVRIDRNRLIEIVDAFVETVFSELARVVLSFQIKLIRFGVCC